MILLQLNELNFDLVEKYVQKYQKKLSNFRRLYDQYYKVETNVHEEYSAIEPWIQWVSFYTKSPYSKHGIFRLGEADSKPGLKFFTEDLMAKGKTVGTVGAMNLPKHKGNFKFFIPDAWSSGNTDGTIVSKSIWSMLSQTVNENSSGKVSMKSLCILLILYSFFIPFRSKILIATLVLKSFRKKWFKALVLDVLLSEVFLSKVKKTKPDFSLLFLNAAAHIQHHYLLNSEHSDSGLKNPPEYVKPSHDPILDMLLIYDKLLGIFLDYCKSKAEDLAVVTAISQIPYEMEKTYYRPKNHKDFLNMLGLEFVSVKPRMTRDFMLELSNAEEAQLCAEELSTYYFEPTDTPLFGDLSVRGKYVDVTLKIDRLLSSDDYIKHKGRRYGHLTNYLVLVALKNGMHSPRGFAFLPFQPLTDKADLVEVANWIHKKVSAYS